MTRSEQINELAAALAKAQGEFPKIAKNRENPYFRSRYADLEAIVEATRGPLSKFALCVTQSPEVGPEGVTVRTTLIHGSGQWLESSLLMPLGKRDVQGVGIAITYGRRYGLQAMLGVAAEEDDDGNGAVEKPQPQQRRPAPPPRQQPGDTQDAAVRKELDERFSQPQQVRVDEKTGEVLPADPVAQTYADNDLFKKGLVQVFHDAGFTVRDRDIVLKGILNTRGLKGTANIPVGERAQLIQDVALGKFEKFKTIKGSELEKPKDAA